MEWHSPHVWWLLLLLPLMIWLQRRFQRPAGLRFSSLQIAGQVDASWRVRLRYLPQLSRWICVICLIAALARPREGMQQTRVSTQGVVMYLVVDVSSSMLEPMAFQGRRMTRLEVVKETLDGFIRGEDGMSGRQDDLLGLVTFARYADTICPLVVKHDILTGFLKQTQTVTPNSELDGTAIGEGLRLAAARLHEAQKDLSERNRQLAGAESGETASKPEFEIQSKVIVLLTDGEDTADSDPLQAARLAQEWGVKVYTIGIGNSGGGGLFAQLRASLDEPLLRRIAEMTGAFYGRADDADQLRQVIQKIDEEEKTEIESVEYSMYVERFSPWAWAALLTLSLEVLLRCTIFRRNP